jgi:hypothetical protein
LITVEDDVEHEQLDNETDEEQVQEDDCLSYYGEEIVSEAETNNEKDF